MTDERLSIVDIFKIGVGPSSSHTLGPWRAAQRFVAACHDRGLLARVVSVRVDLYGSLAKTGKGHATDLAVVLGLAGEDPVTCDPTGLRARVDAVRAARRLSLGGAHAVSFDPATDVVFNRDRALPYHPNALTFTATLADATTHAETYYSVGGGFVVSEREPAPVQPVPVPYPIATAADLARHCREQAKTIPQVVWENELAWRSADEVRRGLARIWGVMKACAFAGCTAEGVLPGGLDVVRRAARINRRLLAGRLARDPDEWIAAVRGSTRGFDDILAWVSCFALAVNEENAALGRVVTAPTNGAAGVVPAVLLYDLCFRDGASEADAEPFLLTAAVLGSIFKQGATISAAMGGCQAEIGVSSAMAAGALTQVRGGDVDRVLAAAEIAMEHHLGMTCDPIGGLVQIPCIERNTMGAVKAITASQIALESDPTQAKVSLDAVIRTMWDTARDMSTKYKETAEGGLAAAIPVNVPEC